ncbi:MAG: hypothetical protein WCL13_02510 [bacterium]
MEEIISKEEFEKIKKAPGEMRGNGDKSIGDYILEKEGENGLQKVEEIMKGLGYPIEYRKINEINYYPAWLADITFLIVKRLFNFTNEDFQKMGAREVKFTPVKKFFVKYFVSLKTVCEAASKIFSQYYTEGKLEMMEFNEKERRAILKVSQFGSSEANCQYFIGYVVATAGMASKYPITCEETKCIYRGDKYHEFVIKWGAAIEEINLQEEINKLMGIKGEVREVALKNHRDFILEKKGEEGLKKFEETIGSLKGVMQYKKLKMWEFYPIGLEVIELLVMKKIFNFDDEKIKEIGAFESRVSFVIKLFLQYIGSTKLLAKKAPEMWKKYYTAGELIVKEINEEKKYAILDVKDFNFHPIHCLNLNGYFSNMVKMASGSKTVDCQETKCVHLGDEYHEFLIKW